MSFWKFSLAVGSLLVMGGSLSAAEVVEIPDPVAEVLDSRHPKNASDLKTLESHIRQIVEQINSSDCWSRSWSQHWELG